MATATVNGINIAYELNGSTDKPVVLLIHGLSMSIPAWPPAFLSALQDAGFTLLMFDNRDMGHSQHFTEAGVPNFGFQILKNKIGFPIKTVYKLTDLMQDAVSLLDHLKIPKAHVLGVSMGGMIAQLMAIHHPEKCLSMTSIMSTTGRKGLPSAKKEVISHLLSAPASDSMADKLKFSVRTWELIGSPDYPTDEETIGVFIKSLMERGMPRAGTARQMLAIMAAKGRNKDLNKLSLPSLIIHGKDDPLVPVECGIDTAESIPDSKLEIIDGMGHDFPVQLIPEISQKIIDHLNTSTTQ